MGGINLNYNGDYAKIDMEFLAGATVVLAVAIRPPFNFASTIHVGNTVGAVAGKPYYGTYPSVDGVLTVDVDGVRYTPNPTTTQNTSAFFHAKDLSGVTAVRFTVQALTKYTAALTLSASAFVQIMGRLKGVVVDGAGAPAERLIRTIREDTGAAAGYATSSATTGAYTVATEFGGAHTLIAYPAAGENLPALALRGVVPI